jgi:hypothetical protein
VCRSNVPIERFHGVQCGRACQQITDEVDFEICLGKIKTITPLSIIGQIFAIKLVR